MSEREEAESIVELSVDSKATSSQPPPTEILSEDDTAREQAKTRKYTKMLIVRIIIRISVVTAIIVLVVKFKININEYLRFMLDFIYDTFGEIWSAVLFCITFSIWTSISPMGYLPTVLCGIFLKWYIAPFIAYISVNIGSLINVLIIRYLILPNRDKPCIKQILGICCGRKVGQISFLRKLFIATSPIKVVVLLRLPYLNNGIINYLFSLQTDTLSIKQNIVGNLIGFIPGSIIFSIFGQEIKSFAKIISDGFDSTKQLILFFSISVGAVICYLVIAFKVKSWIKLGNRFMYRSPKTKTITPNEVSSLNA